MVTAGDKNKPASKKYRINTICDNNVNRQKYKNLQCLFHTQFHLKHW